ncbi:hypothetical protein FA15DRAFT_657034 [Coprinopsis marcescibilis]|uniref:Uncharacterized protein n=1 Tax=Coprinopsis marcescibilis TaxID=230819 RepID=A0A5C3KRF3_COPMA|nr:hypothetical protein FA15DRAFT_657034 [Coprinopsis marcescibilis]
MEGIGEEGTKRKKGCQIGYPDHCNLLPVLEEGNGSPLSVIAGGTELWARKLACVVVVEDPSVEDNWKPVCQAGTQWMVDEPFTFADLDFELLSDGGNTDGVDEATVDVEGTSGSVAAGRHDERRALRGEFSSLTPRAALSRSYIAPESARAFDWDDDKQYLSKMEKYVHVTTVLHWNNWICLPEQELSLKDASVMFKH